MIHAYLKKEKTTEVFKKNGSKFTDRVQPICKVAKKHTALDYLELVRHSLELK